MQIENTSAVVTGAGGGIGFAVARALAEKGAGIIGVVDVSEDCAEAARRINQAVGADTALAFQGDVTCADFRRQVFAEIKARHGAVQICVPAAGILRDNLAVKINKQSGAPELYSEETFAEVLRVNLTHPVYWAMQTLAGIAEMRAAANLKKWRADEALQGSIVLIGSVSSRGNRGQIAYACAKSALNAACTTLNVEGMYHGVQTRIVHPGVVETNMSAQLPPGYFEQHMQPQIPLGRMLMPDEIAAGVVALIENPVVSGALWLDGGMTPMA